MKKFTGWTTSDTPLGMGQCMNSPQTEIVQYTFPSECRIKTRREIVHLQNSGRPLYSRDFVILVGPSAHSNSRLALTVSRRVSRSACQRNRIKRRLRELFRINRSRLVQPFDILIIARKNAAQIDFAEIKRQVLGALYHNKLLRNEEESV